MRTSCPGRYLGIDAARGVRDDERADPEPTEHAHAERHAIRADALVEMRTPAHDRERHASERAEHQRARMPDRRRDRPAGNLGIRDLDRLGELVGQSAQPAAEDHPDARRELRPLPDSADGVVETHTEPSATRLS